jgi:hypothetical protein
MHPAKVGINYCIWTLLWHNLRTCPCQVYPPRVSPRNMANYDSLHRQCRTLESLFDAKLTSYARLAASISRAGTDDDLEAGPSWREAESGVADLLEKVRSLLSTPLSFDEPRRPTGVLR